jgi:hypothetical protein
MEFHQAATFLVAPERIYELLTDGSRFSRLVGGRARGGTAKGAVGPFGVRVVSVRTLANTDSRSIQQTTEFLAGRMNIPQDQAITQIAESNFLKRLAGVSDTAKAAVLVASDNARMMTGTVVNATAGAALD